MSRFTFHTPIFISQKERQGEVRGTGWSQEARLVLSEAEPPGPLPLLPNTISEGFLEVGGIRHEPIPLPFKRKVGAKLWLVFIDGLEIQITGKRPFINTNQSLANTDLQTTAPRLLFASRLPPH